MTAPAVAVSLDSFVAHVAELAERHEDIVADTRTIGFHVDGADEFAEAYAEGKTPDIEDIDVGLTTVMVDDVVDERGDAREFTVNAHAHHQIASRLEVPLRYYDRLRTTHPDLLQHNVRALLTREPARRMIRTLDGTARAFLSDRYRRLDNHELLQHAIVPALNEGGTNVEVKATRLTATRMYVKVEFPDLRDEVKVGDIVVGGILISNSEVGAGALTVDPLIGRLVCANGMIVPVADFAEWGIRRQHVGRQITEEDASVFSDRTLQLDDQAFYAKVYDVVKNASDGIKFAAIVAKMRDLADLTVDAPPVEAVQRLASRYSITQGEQDIVHQHLVDGGDRSAWGYLNAVTRTAQDVESYDRQIELERVGGNILAASRRQLREAFAIGA